MSEHAAKPAGVSVGSVIFPPDTSGRPPEEVGTLRQLWRFRNYGRVQLKSLMTGVVMRGCELAADLAAPWPLALVIDYLSKGGQVSGPLGWAAGWFGSSAVAVLGVAAVAVLIITVLSGVFDYLGDLALNGAGERMTSHIRSDVFGYMERLPQDY
ncbi:MAG TPA: hypothetical protein VK735_00610, partial [Pseudonocardia sp.]|uniref:hypothetical protein n=1 Tax=Pseudonocardia sp. TaxID=60912 RepID=UPI002CA8718B